MFDNFQIKKQTFFYPIELLLFFLILTLVDQSIIVSSFPFNKVKCINLKWKKINIVTN